MGEVTADMTAIRASDAERDRVVSKLEREFAAGRLNTAELEQRIVGAQRARTRAQLRALTCDLPPDSARPQTTPPVADPGLMCLLRCCYPLVSLVDWLVGRGAAGRAAQTGGSQGWVSRDSWTATDDRERAR